MNKTVLIAAVFLLFINVNVEAQCAMCRAVLESDTDSSTAKGMNNGIVYLMAFPYIMVGVIGYFIYKSRQKAKAEEVN